MPSIESYFSKSETADRVLYLNSQSKCSLSVAWSRAGDLYEDILEKQGFLLAEITDKRMPINYAIKHCISAVFISCVRPRRYSGDCQWSLYCSRKDSSLEDQDRLRKAQF